MFVFRSIIRGEIATPRDVSSIVTASNQRKVWFRMASPSIPLKRCTKCGQEKPETHEFFSYHKMGRNGLWPTCRECNKKPSKREVLPPGQKRCTRCKEVFPADEIHFRYRKSHNALFSKCRQCEHLRDAELRHENAEQIQASQLRYIQNHPDRVKATKVKWDKANTDQRSIYAKQRYVENRDELLAKCREWQIANPEKRKARNQKRRSLRHNAEGTHTSDQIRELYQEQNGLCAYCGVRIMWGIPYDVHLDHVTPLSRGGSNWIDNILLCCQPCNLSKSKRMLDEWMRVRGW